MGRAMDTASLSDAEARSVGLWIGWLRLLLFCVAGILTAMTVALAGPIAFVGIGGATRWPFIAWPKAWGLGGWLGFDRYRSGGRCRCGEAGVRSWSGENANWRVHRFVGWSTISLVTSFRTGAGVTISVANLNVSYGRWQALHDVSCQAQAGKITVVVGPNASGKSTLLRTIAGVQRPSHGRITIQRRGSVRSIKRLSPRKRAVALAYVAQRPTISARFSVRQVVSLGRYALGRSEDRVDWAMEMVGLQQSLFHRPFAELSVGQQQLVAVARALAQLGPDPQKTLDMSGRYLVLDEPTAALDLKQCGGCHCCCTIACRCRGNSSDGTP